MKERVLNKTDKQKNPELAILVENLRPFGFGLAYYDYSYSSFELNGKFYNFNAEHDYEKWAPRVRTIFEKIGEDNQKDKIKKALGIT